jgi:leucyl-tRNA synthetase
VTVSAGSPDEALREAALGDKKVQGYLEGMELVKTIVVKEKLINLILRPVK